MSWIFVVVGLVALAIGLHFVEQAKARASRAQKRARREQERGELRWFSYTREIREKWDVDFKPMQLRVGREDASGVAPEPSLYELDRDPAGAWLMRPASVGSGPSPAEKVPLPIAEKLEARYQRFLSESRDDEPAPSRSV